MWPISGQGLDVTTEIHRQLHCYRSEPVVMKEVNTHVYNMDMKSKLGTIDNKKSYVVIPSVDMIIGVL